MAANRSKLAIALRRAHRVVLIVALAVGQMATWPHAHGDQPPAHTDRPHRHLDLLAHVLPAGDVPRDDAHHRHAGDQDCHDGTGGQGPCHGPSHPGSTDNHDSSCVYVFDPGYIVLPAASTAGDEANAASYGVALDSFARRALPAVSPRFGSDIAPEALRDRCALIVRLRTLRI